MEEAGLESNIDKFLNSECSEKRVDFKLYSELLLYEKSLFFKIL